VLLHKLVLTRWRRWGGKRHGLRGSKKGKVWECGSHQEGTGTQVISGGENALHDLSSTRKKIRSCFKSSSKERGRGEGGSQQEGKSEEKGLICVESLGSLVGGGPPHEQLGKKRVL